METPSLLEKANKWLNKWTYDLSFIDTRTLLAAFMEGFRYSLAEKIQNEKRIDWMEYKEKAIKAYQKGIDWVQEYNEKYLGNFFTRGCVISAYIQGLTLNI